MKEIALVESQIVHGITMTYTPNWLFVTEACNHH